MPAGRPTKMTEETMAKLREAFSAGSTDKEACAHAGISESTLYDYQVSNPDFLDEKEALKEMPAIAARMLVSRKVKTDVNTATWYLERKKKEEFSTRNELTGKDGKDLPAPILTNVHSDNGNKETTEAE